LTIHDYGESWDEYNFFKYANESLAAYPGLFQKSFQLEFSDPTLRYYGAWLPMSVVTLARLFPQWLISDISHLFSFILFQIGVLLMYLLAKRWYKPLTSFGVAVLFTTQPLLWGHAFINLRDSPFMTGFLASIYFGYKLVDSLDLKNEIMKNKTFPNPDLSPAKKTILTILTVIGMIVFGFISLYLIKVFEGRGVLLADTSSAQDLDLYLRPILAKFWVAVIFICLTITWICILFLPLMRDLRTHLWENELHPYVVQMASCLKNRNFIIASIVLGLTIGIRVMGLAAFGLISVFLIIKYKRRSIVPILVYLVLGMIIAYVTWPYIWKEPILRLLITLRVMMRFPWPGLVLFNGAYYAGIELPRSYLPTLLGFQLTIPLLLFLLTGFGVALWQILRKKKIHEVFLLSLLWFGLPFTAVLVGQPYMYDNFRQLFFILPPLFLLAGLGIDLTLKYLRHPILRLTMVGLTALPLVISMVVLHPYEYIYYNELSGGISTTFRRYEMDYWGTSFREVSEYLNTHVPKNARTVVWGPPTTLWRYIRPDIKVYEFSQDDAPTSDYYAVILTRNDNDLKYHTNLPALFTVQRQGAILSEVKYVP
jgi:hypothetical protein